VEQPDPDEIERLLHTEPAPRDRFEEIRTADPSPEYQERLDLILGGYLHDPDAQVAEKALLQLMSLYRTMIERQARGRSATQDGDDLFQKTWLRAARGRHRFTPGSPFRSWVYTIARRLNCDEGEKVMRQRQQTLSEEMAARLPDGAGVRRLQENLLSCDPQDLAWLLSHLNPGERQLVELYYLEGRTYLQLADHFQIAPAAPKNTRITRVRRWLNEVLGRLRDLWGGQA
jgi:RNA polymerase sigma-70 factor (ECF subfamily)